jgi:hypothetical protein
VVVYQTAGVPKIEKRVIVCKLVEVMRLYARRGPVPRGTGCCCWFSLPAASFYSH